VVGSGVLAELRPIGIDNICCLVAKLACNAGHELLLRLLLQGGQVCRGGYIKPGVTAWVVSGPGMGQGLIGQR